MSREDGDDKESESIENQRDILLKYINENKDLYFVEEYVDDGFSGTHFDRPSFKKMLKDIDTNIIDTVITKDLSRFGRDHIDTGYYVERYFPTRNIRYIAIGDNLDTIHNSSMNFMTFKMSFNDYYSQDISNKIKAVKKRKQEKGEYMAPFAPLGYMKDTVNKNHLLINKETSWIITRIFDLYLSGNSTTKIAKILNEEKVPTPSKLISAKNAVSFSGKWGKGNVSRILNQEVYIGKIACRKTYKVNHKVKKRIIVDKNEWIYSENMHEPLISIKDFEKVQKKLSESKSTRKRKYDNPLKAFTYCGICGRKTIMKTHKKKVKSGEIREHSYFRCAKKSDGNDLCENGSISASILNKIVDEQIKDECSKIVFSDKEIMSLYEQAKQNINTKKKLINNEINKETLNLTKIEKKISQIYNDKLEGIIESSEFILFYNDFKSKKEESIKKLSRLKKDLQDASEEKMVNYDYIKNIAQECLNMKELNVEIISKLIERIEYFKDRKIKIIYKFIESK